MKKKTPKIVIKIQRETPLEETMYDVASSLLLSKTKKDVAVKVFRELLSVERDRIHDEAVSSFAEKAKEMKRTPDEPPRVWGFRNRE